MSPSKNSSRVVFCASAGAADARQATDKASADSIWVRMIPPFYRWINRRSGALFGYRITTRIGGPLGSGGIVTSELGMGMGMRGHNPNLLETPMAPDRPPALQIDFYYRLGLVSIARGQAVARPPQEMIET